MKHAEPSKPRLVIGVSGASGAVYGVRALQAARELDLETHLVVSKAAAQTLQQEIGLSPADLAASATFSYRPGDVGAAIASGSFHTLGMIIAPCSVRTLSEIASGMTTSLLTRAADVTLKERRPLVLMVRETPFHLGHLRTMVRAAEIGAIILPPIPGMYARPRTVEDIINHTVGKALDQFGIPNELFARWQQD